MPLRVLVKVASVTPGCLMPVAGLRTALTESRTLICAEAPQAARSARRRSVFFITFLSPGPRLLEGDEDEDEPPAGFKAGHGLADDRALRAVVVGDLHGVAGRFGSGEQIAGANRAVGGIDLAIDATRKRDGMFAVCDGAGLAHQHSWLHATGTADDTGDGAVVGCTRHPELAGIFGIDADDHAGLERFMDGVDIELLGKIGAASDLEDLGGDTAFAVVIRVERDGLRAVVLFQADLTAGGVLAVAAPEVDRFVAEPVADADDAFFIFPAINAGVQMPGIVVEEKTSVVGATINPRADIAVGFAQADRAGTLAVVTVDHGAGLTVTLIERKLSSALAVVAIEHGTGAGTICLVEGDDAPGVFAADQSASQTVGVVKEHAPATVVVGGETSGDLMSRTVPEQKFAVAD